jgi:3-methyladenine DNA glycosylase AlkD
VKVRLRDLGDPLYVAGTVAARSPGKPVLGIRIPLLRGAVRDALRLARRDSRVTPDAVREAGEALWHGQFHEEELAACMLLRLSGVRVTAGMIRRWAGWLDNWLSVDELGGCLGEALVDDPALLNEVEFLAGSTSPWERRLYVVGLIRPVRDGLDPAAAGRLVQVMQDDAKPVRKASMWLISNVVKARPSAAAQFLAVWPSSAPKPLTRLLERVPVG